jgi:hypothetical protein
MFVNNFINSATTCPYNPKGKESLLSDAMLFYTQKLLKGTNVVGDLGTNAVANVFKVSKNSFSLLFPFSD